MVLTVSGSACGGSDERDEPADSTGSMDTAQAADDADPPRDIESYSTVTPVDRETGSAGGIEVMATSFCGEPIGDGVEILATGLEPMVVVDATVNGQSASLQAVSDDPAVQIRTDSAPTYTVEVPTPDGPIVIELDGCG